MTNEKILNLFIEILPNLIKDNEKEYTNNSLLSVNGEIVGKYCIIRTYSAGVWAGYLQTKHQNEVILKDARRLWRWHTKSSISLSAIAIEGLNYEYSKVCAPVNTVWLQPIEIIPCTIDAKNNIIQTPICEAE